MLAKYNKEWLATGRVLEESSQCGIKRPNNPFEELLIVLERTIAEDSWLAKHCPN